MSVYGEYVPHWLPAIATARAEVLRRQHRDLETWLRALLGLIGRRTPGPLTLDEVNLLIKEALVAEPVPFDGSWNSVTPDQVDACLDADGPVEEQIEATLTILRGQVADLRWLDAQPPRPYFDNEAAPRGTWANGNSLEMFLESAGAGACGNELTPDPEDRPDANWQLLRRLLLLGQVYE